MKTMKNLILLLIIGILFSSCGEISTIEFYKACRSGNVEKVEMALKQNKELAVSKLTKEESISYEKWEKSKIYGLSTKGIDFSKFPYVHTKPIESAIDADNSEIIRLLVENGADLNDALFQASIKGKSNSFNTLVKLGADVNGYLILSSAAEGGFTDIVKTCIENGANVNAVDSSNTTPLLASCFAESELSTIVKLLLEAGADPNIARNDNVTPLLVACQNNYTEIAEMLLEAKANPNIPYEKTGVTPLMFAAQINNKNLVNLLIKNGANKEAKDNNGFKAYQYAEDKNYFDLATKLNPYRKKTVTEIKMGYEEISDSEWEKALVFHEAYDQKKVKYTATYDSLENTYNYTLYIYIDGKLTSNGFTTLPDAIGVRVYFNEDHKQEMLKQVIDWTSGSKHTFYGTLGYNLMGSMVFQLDYVD